MNDHTQHTSIEYNWINIPCLDSAGWCGVLAGLGRAIQGNTKRGTETGGVQHALDRPESVSMPKCFCWHLVETATTHCQHQHTFFCGIPHLQSVRYPGQGSCFSQVRVKHRFPTLQELGRHPQRCAFHFFLGGSRSSMTIYNYLYMSILTI